jgi:hypothetical protein
MDTYGYASQRGSAKPVLTVLLVQSERVILASGVHEDTDVIRNAHFDSLNDALQYIERRFQPTYRIVLNIPKNIRR